MSDTNSNTTTKPPHSPQQFTRYSLLQLNRVLHSNHSSSRPVNTVFNATMGDSTCRTIRSDGNSHNHSNFKNDSNGNGDSNERRKRDNGNHKNKTLSITKETSTSLQLSSSSNTNTNTNTIDDDNFQPIPLHLLSSSSSTVTTAATTNQINNKNNSSTPFSVVSLLATTSSPFSFEEIYEAPASLGKQLEIRWFHSNSNHNSYANSANAKSPKSTINNNDDQIGRKDSHYTQQNNNVNKSVTLRHTMPFLRRSLSYIQLCNILTTSTSTYSANHNRFIKSPVLKKRKYVSNQIRNKKKRMMQDNQSKEQQQPQQEQQFLLPIQELLQIQHNTKNKDLLESIFHYHVHHYNSQLHTITSRTRTTRKSLPYTDKDNKSSNDKTTKNHNHHNNGINHTQNIKLGTEKQFQRQARKASTFGKSFPPYRPYEKGQWKVPIPCKKAFELYCERQLGKEMTSKFIDHMHKVRMTEIHATALDTITEGGKSSCATDKNTYNNNAATMEESPSRGSSSYTNDRQEKVLLRQIKSNWNLLSSTERMYWIQEEEWDKARYFHEKYIYDTAKEQGSDIFDNNTNKNNYMFSNMVWAKSLDHDCCTQEGACACQKEGKICKKERIHHQMNIGIVVYYYVYYHLNDIQIQTERRCDRCCPFCSFNAGSNIGILIHLDTTHGDSLSFKGGIDKNNNFNVMMKSKVCGEEKKVISLFGIQEDMMTEQNFNLKNFVFIASKYSATTRTDNKHTLIEFNDIHNIEFIDLPRQSDSITRKRKIGSTSLDQQEGGLSPKSSPFKRRNHEKPKLDPIRQYYHSRTNLPISKSAWDKDVDSDDEDYDDWIRQMENRLMDELDDVSKGEKEFMSLWNNFIKTNVVMADRTIPKKCREFILIHHAQISKLDLRMHLVLHLFNLWDNGLLRSKVIVNLMLLFDEMTTSALNNARWNSAFEGSSEADEKKIV